ncbi:hypothetical protein AB0I84_26960, partial [Streptomyces spectabilis]|uniref:hypothetical protein n=1 Tax=Streptomyces spectabilis TaxID=68270 RepID=UPI0033E841DA
ESPEPTKGQLSDPEPPFARGESASSARAAGNYMWMWTDDSARGGLVYFEPADSGGDAVTLIDKESDGRGVRISVWDETRDPDVHKFTFYNRYGKDQRVVSNAGLGGSYDLAEGHCFKFRIQLVDGNNVIESSTDYAQWRNDNQQVSNCDDVE